MSQQEQRPIVALIYDFDGTLSPGNMQEYDFIPAVGKSNRDFWEESNDTAREQDGDPFWPICIACCTRLKVRANRCDTKRLYSRDHALDCTKGLKSGFRELMRMGHPKVSKYNILLTLPDCVR